MQRWIKLEMMICLQCPNEQEKKPHSPHSQTPRLKTRYYIYCERMCIFFADFSVCAIKSVPQTQAPSRLILNSLKKDSRCKRDKRRHLTKDTKEGLMPTLVPMATIIASLLCLLLSLALIRHKMALRVWWLGARCYGRLSHHYKWIGLGVTEFGVTPKKKKIWFN